ncbi:enhanced serine sensitivity protein SseB C-terminal domain-containing protein [Hymenobacter sp. BT188]|uniref:enhanced serine sensitivity protein SseB C-terminal domain-containing protein n=1 Tax=Hymenobacter sp. BT188 TaxID=2763504 RepID=UPI001651AFBC|nr:enhanced serine sensitivity protein SseB C-terminal domain-containing protein [Hymenobacter sp. BT188]MBC6605953.1 enhanced serine sensitivity protein SseB C-terminal domain-containing protein [Hymenobacter sp. BT188]
MGLFDFLKSKKQPVQTPAPADPAPASATPATGPRYKGANFTSPVAPPPPAPVLPPPPPPMPAFEPVNRLEEMLLHAAADPDARHGFYQALLQEDVLVLTQPKEGQPGGEIPVTENMEVQLQVLHDGKIPVFTSPGRIFDSSVVKEEVPYLRLSGFDLFQMVKGADCALNPFSSLGKLLMANELEDLLAGHLFQAPAHQIPPDTQVLLGQPAEVPTALIESLSTYAADQPLIRAIYLAELQLPDNPEPARLLLGFEVEGDDTSFLQEIGAVIQHHLDASHQFVDIVLISPESEEPLSHYFYQNEPIYKRSE